MAGEASEYDDAAISDGLVVWGMEGDMVLGIRLVV